MRSTTWWAAAAALCFVLTGSPASAVERPVASSPGNPSRLVLTAARCPTFSWGSVPGATSYELVVYRIEEAGSEPVPILRQRFPGSVASWTPSLDHCLEPGSRYAWAVRAVSGKDASDWSRLRLFEVAAEPGELELRRALAVVEKHLQQSESAGATQDGPPEATARQGGVDEVAAGPSDSSEPTSGVEISDHSISIGGEEVVTAATDRDTLGALSCTDSEVAKWSGSSWVCAPDVDTNTDTLAGLICSSGEVAKWIGSAWVCFEDWDTLYDLGLACSTNEIPKWNGAAWVCAPDDDTTYAIGGGLILENGVVSVDPGAFSTRISILDSAGSDSSIAIGADGLGLISYVGDTGLKVAHCDNVLCSSATITTLEIAVVEHTSIAIGTDGLGLISYYDQTLGALKAAHCDNALCTSATTATLDNDADVSFNTSIAIGADDLGLISYDDDFHLTVAHCVDVSCSLATTTTLNSHCRHSSMAIGADGLGLISYWDGTEFVTAHCDNALCTSSFDSIFATSDAASSAHTSIAVGSDGLGLISFWDDQTFGDLNVAHCNDVLCSSAGFTTLDPNGGLYSSIAIGADGLGLIVYWEDPPDRGLKVAHCDNSLCISASLAILDRNYGSNISIALGSDGVGLISYYDESNNLFKVGHLGIGVP